MPVKPQHRIYLTKDLYPDIPAVIEKLKKLMGIATQSQAVALALREDLKRREHQKALEERRNGKA